MSTATKPRKTAGQQDGIVSRPILFSGPMVRAILERRKTITRRVMKLPRWAQGRDVHLDEHKLAAAFCGSVETDAWIPCPFAKIKVEHQLPEIGFKARYEPGRRLWVKETWARSLHNYLYAADCIASEGPQGNTDEWDWDSSCGPNHWRPSIFMTRAASRITLEVTNVRVERLRDITAEDIRAEGFDISDINSRGWNRDVDAGKRFAELWDQLNEARGFGWATNPWVWVVEFKRV